MSISVWYLLLRFVYLPTTRSFRRNLLVKKLTECDYVRLVAITSFFRFFQGFRNHQMNALNVHVFNSSRRHAIIDGCQEQCAVEFLHCHLLPALTKGGFCRKNHCFFKFPLSRLQNNKVRQHKIRATSSRYRLLFKINPSITKKSCYVLFKGTTRPRFSVLACAQESCIQIGKSTHD